MRKNLSLFLLIIIFVLFSGFGCKCVSNDVEEKMKEVNLNFWRVWEGDDVFGSIISQYQKLHPYVSVNYRKLQYSEYEQKLLEAFASDKSPDIFSLHNTWTRRYQKKGWITPIPPKITMAYPVLRGKIKKEIIPELRTKKSPNLNDIKNDFVDVVYDDVVIKGKNPQSRKVSTDIYGLPMAMDTLIMFVNRDLFDNAGITSIPKYWNKEFQQIVRKLTKQDNKGQIMQSGVALGGADNIERSSDILSVLMMQNGAEMSDVNNRQVTFHKNPGKLEIGTKNPGADALRFYTDFANPAKEVYSWNSTMDDSLDLFIRGKIAMMFGYSYMIPQIKAGNPKLNLLITRLPQIEGNESVNFANYWVETVSTKSRNIDTAWDFLVFASAAEQVESYLKKTKKLTALRDLVNVQAQDLEIGPYVNQVLTAKSWYKGKDSVAAEEAMRDMIKMTIDGQATAVEAVELGVEKVQQTY